MTQNILGSITLIAALGFLIPGAALAADQSQFASGWSVTNNADWTPFPPSANPLGAPDSDCVDSSAGAGIADFTFPAFSLPAGATVTGIEVTFRYNAGSDTNPVQLTDGGTPTGSSKSLANNAPGTCNDTSDAVVGGDPDLWGTSLVAADFNAGSVGVRFDRESNTTLINSVQLKVFFTGGGDNQEVLDAIAALEVKADAFETKADAIEVKADGLEVDVASIDTTVTTINGAVTALESKADAIEIKLDALPLDALEAKADALEAKADVLEGKADALGVQVADVKAELVDVKAEVTDIKVEMVDIKAEIVDLTEIVERIEMEIIENACLENKHLPTVYLPPAQGGQLDVVRQKVADTIANVLASGETVNNAQAFLNSGDTKEVQGRYKAAFTSYCQALCLAVSESGRVSGCYPPIFGRP